MQYLIEADLAGTSVVFKGEKYISRFVQSLIEADLAGMATRRMGFSAPASSLIDFGLEGWGGDSLMEFCQSHHIYITLTIPRFSIFYLRGHTEKIFENCPELVVQRLAF